MTARAMRILADSLENQFMTEEDRKGWVTTLRGNAKSLEWRAMEAAERDKEAE